MKDSLKESLKQAGKLIVIATGIGVLTMNIIGSVKSVLMICDAYYED